MKTSVRKAMARLADAGEVDRMIVLAERCGVRVPEELLDRASLVLEAELAEEVDDEASLDLMGQLKLVCGLRTLPFS